LSGDATGAGSDFCCETTFAVLAVCELVNEVATRNLWLVSNSGERVDRTLLRLFSVSPLMLKFPTL